MNVYRKYIKNKSLLTSLQHNILPNVFAEDEGNTLEMVTHRFSLLCQKGDVRFIPLLLAIANEDFPQSPKIFKQNNQIGYDIYFINVTKKMIYHLYDDRGCDVIASTREDLRQLNKIYNEWILDYDREQIDKLFERDNFQPTAD